MEYEKINKDRIKKPDVEIGSMSLSSTKIGIDNSLPGLENYLKKIGFRHVVEVPKFENLPEKEKSGPYINKIWKDKAINRWLNQNKYKIFVTNNEKDFKDFDDRKYGIIAVKENIKKDHEKLARKIKILFANASHPNVQLFSPFRIYTLSLEKKLVFSKVKKSRR